MFFFHLISPYHDIVALHLCLLVGQFVILHLKTEITQDFRNYISSTSTCSYIHASLQVGCEQFFLDNQHMHYWWNTDLFFFWCAALFNRVRTFWLLPVILSLQELKFILDSVARLCHSEFKAWLTRLVGRLKDSHHTSIKLNYIPWEPNLFCSKTQSEAQMHSAPAGSTSNISDP